MSEILDGKSLAKKIRLELKEKILNEGIKPKLAVILVGDDEASIIYVNNKNKACKEIGMDFVEYHLSSVTTQSKLLDLIERLNNDDTIDGILLQYPIPKGLNIEEAFEKISPKKDVDGFNPQNIGLRTIGGDCFVPCTPLGIMRILDEYNIEIEGKKALVIGRSNTVGKPVAQLLLERNATVTICHSKSTNIANEIKQADIVVSAVGKAKFITEDMIKDNAVIIDVGISRLSNGKICGDVDFENIQNKCSYITPVPGGIGPMTIAMLLSNTLKAFEKRRKK